MAEGSAIEKTDSIYEVLAHLVALENKIDPEIRVYMFRPDVPNVPCIWNELQSSSFEIIDQSRWRDTLSVVVTLVVQHSDVNIEQMKLLKYVDNFRRVVDLGLYGKLPLGATRAKRLGMQNSYPSFSGVSYLGMEFALQIEVDRFVPPN